MNDAPAENLRRGVFCGPAHNILLTVMKLSAIIIKYEIVRLWPHLEEHHYENEKNEEFGTPDGGLRCYAAPGACCIEE